MGSQRFCLRWNNHQSNLLSVFDQLLHDEAFVDVTLAVEGQLLRAHKMVLSACSPYFQALFVGHPDKHPIVILKDVPYSDMRSLLDFMYRGEVSVDQDRLTAFLKVAESLRIKGLTEVNEERCDLPSIANSLLSQVPPAPVAQQAPSQPQQQHHQQPPNLHRIQLPQAKRSNPMLNSALTAPPKRKRGRPRKLSGSNPGTPNPLPPTIDTDHDEIKHNSVEHHSGGSVIIAQGNGIVTGGDSQSEVLSPLMTKKDEKEEAKEMTPPPPVSLSQPPPASNSTPPGPAPGFPGTVSQLGAPDPNDPSAVKMEPTPGTSTQDSVSSFQSSNNTSEGDRFSTSGKRTPALGEYADDSDEDSEKSDLIECYDDMIACSPGSEDTQDQAEEMPAMKEKVSLNAGVTIEPEFVDVDISQYELDSFQSLMNQQSSSFSPFDMSTNTEGKKRIDKMSIRKYCTREGNHMYRCTMCSKTYTHISNFCRHFLSAHCGVKQDVQCPVCFKPFTRKDNMMTHAKQVHGVTIMKSTNTDHSTEQIADYNLS